jgi:hypothetical protein
MGNLPFDRLNNIVSSIIPNHIVSQLNMIWISNPYIYINTWSVFHFMWGSIMPFVIGPNRPLYALFIHTVWEGIEYILAYGGHPLFVEEAVDILWDTLLYMIGYMIISKGLTYSRKSYMKLPQYTV